MGAEDIEERAARWLVQMEAAENSTDMQSEFAAWLAENPAHAEAFFRVRQGWNAAEAVRKLRPVDGKVIIDLFPLPSRTQDIPGERWRAHGGGQDFFVARPRRFIVWPSRFRLIVMAAGLATVALGLLAWQMLSEHAKTHEYATEIGGRLHVTLGDGSQVELNTDSLIRVYFTAERREVELERGEALFKVAKDAQRIFQVRADGVNATALGTEFSVRLRNAGITEVMVAEGQVLVSSAASPWPVLVAGDRAIAGPKQVQSKQIGVAEVRRRLAWVSGQIKLMGETLSEAVTEFNRYNLRQISVADPAIAQLRITGHFSTSAPEDFAMSLERPFGVHALGSRDGTRPKDIRLVGAHVIQEQMTPSNK